MRRNEQSAANYLIHPVDTPAHQVYEEKPSRVPSFMVDVLASTFVFGLLVFLACYSFYKDFWPGGVTAIVTLIFFVLRLGRIFDVPIAAIKETIFQDVTPRMAAQPRSIPVTVNNRDAGAVEVRNAKVLSGSKGEYTFSGRQMDQLEDIVDDPAGDGKVRRETSGLGKGLAELGITTGHYPIIYQALKERGYIGQDDKWTELGLRWVKAV